MKQKVILVFLGLIILAIFSGCITNESPKNEVKLPIAAELRGIS